MPEDITFQKDGFLETNSEIVWSDTGPEVWVIPFGMEHTVSYEGGTSKGPQAMIDASSEVEPFDDEFWSEPCRKFRVRTVDAGPIAKTNAEGVRQLAGLTASALKSGAFPFTFGGEHSITAGAIAPFLEKYPDLVLLHFDAHADLRDEFRGDKHSHAWAIRRCLDDESLSVVSICIRNISRTEIPFLEANRHRIHIHWAREKENWHLDEIVKPLAGRPVYVTFDVDGFDSSLMAATGTPEPGGLFWDDAVKILRRAAEVSTFVGADINELAPREGLHACDFLAAKLAYKIMSYKFAL